jgi:transposase-like protein
MTKHSKVVLSKWSLIVSEFIDSKLTAKEYCRISGINVNTLYTWRQRFGLTGNPPTVEFASSSFQELKLSELRESSIADQKPSLEIIFSNNLRVSITKNFDEEILLKTVKVLSKVVC